MTQQARPTLLIVEDDGAFANAVGEAARLAGFDPLYAERGDVGLGMARQLNPVAIVLDLSLPGLHGWSLLDRLKHDPGTAHVPVLVLSGEHQPHRAQLFGAFNGLTKPVSGSVLAGALTELRVFATATVRTLLLIEPEGRRRQALVELLGGDGLEITVVGLLSDARRALDTSSFGAIVTALDLPDGSANEIVSWARSANGGRETPLIIITGSPEKALELGQTIRSRAVHPVASPEHAFERTVRLLHRPQARLPAKRRAMLRELQQMGSPLQGRSVLLVDDDGPSVFALRSVLETCGLEVLVAPDGPACLDLLAKDTPVDAVLMDIMLPEMDGYEVIRRIRSMRSLGPLPVVALTALAMKGDRERCLAAGASSYVAKPVDTDQLLALLRVALIADETNSG